MKLLSQILVVLVTTGFLVHAESAPELSEQTVDVGNDVSLRVIEAGQPASEATLVFIPGWSTTGDIWREQMNRSARTYRVISFDPRSQGKSTITTDGNTPETRAQDLHTLLDLLSVRRPVLIGWSQGVEDIAAFINRYGLAIFRGLYWWMRPFHLEPRASRRAARNRPRRSLRRSPLTRRISRNIGLHDASHCQQTAEQ
jgi:Predicted hydrolases or acyltransferases (alpha/beta hydrolase superfamily)